MSGAGVPCSISASSPPRTRDASQLKAALFSSTAFERPLLLDACQEAGAQAAESEVHAWDADLQFGKARDLLWEPILDGRCVGGCHPVFSVLTRKADLARCLQGSEAARSLIPETLVIDSSDSDSDESDSEPDPEAWRGGASHRLCTEASRLPQVRRHMGQHPPERLWVLKASDSNRGEDIFFVKGDEAGASKVEEKAGGSGSGAWVLQEYVRGLLLLDGRKFHLRAHVVAAGNLAVGVHRHTLVLPASLPLSSSEESLGNNLIHATNACQQHRTGSCLIAEAAEAWRRDLQQQGRHCREGPGEVGAASLGAGPLLGDAAALEPARVVEVVRERISAAVRSAFEAAAARPLGFFPLSNCFQLYGFDFLVDRHLNLILLEVNSDPSIAIFGERLRPQARELLADTLEVGLRMASALGDEAARAPAGDSGAPAAPWRGFDIVLSRAPARTSASARRGLVRRLLLQCGLLAAGGQRANDCAARPLLASVSAGAFGSEAAKEALAGSLGLVWATTPDARAPLSRLQWGQHKEIRWERVMDGSLAANHYFARRALASPACAAQLYLVIAQFLHQCPGAPGGGCSHPMPLTLAKSAGAGRREWQASMEEVLREGAHGAPRDSAWFACPPGLQLWRLHAGASAPVAWGEALDAAFGRAGASAPSRGPWLLQRALLPEGGGIGWGVGFVVRGALLLAGASAAFLHRRLMAVRLVSGRAVESTNASPPERLEELSPRAQPSVFGAARAAACTAASAVWRFSKHAGFMGVPNCFEIFWMHFWVDASEEAPRAWLLSCEAPAENNAAAAIDGSAEQWHREVVRDALVAALPLVGHPLDLCQAAEANAGEKGAISQGFVEIYRHE